MGQTEGSIKMVKMERKMSKKEGLALRAGENGKKKEQERRNCRNFKI